MMTVDDYLALITPWHRGQPKFEATVAASVSMLVALQEIVEHLPADFDLDISIGAQEDVDGEWIGRSRHIPVPIPDLYFSFDDPARGFDKGVWMGPYDTTYGISRLDDETYRQLLYAKIAANNWDGTTEGAAAALETFFQDPDTKMFVEDKGDGTMVFGISGKVPNALFLVLFSRGYIPLKPSGVTAHYLVTSVNNTPMFGFDVDNEFIGGFDAGSWGVSPEYYIQNPIY